MTQTEYEVERVLDMRILEPTVVEFLIKWKGFPSEDNSWEPEANMDCPDMMSNFFHERVKALKVAAKSSVLVKRISCNQYRIKSEKPFTLCVPRDERSRKERLQIYFKKYGAVKERELNTYGQLTQKKDFEERAHWNSKLDQILFEIEVGILEADKVHNFRKSVIAFEYQKKWVRNFTVLQSWEKQMNRVSKRMPKISVVNEVDLTGCPAEFNYVNDYVKSEGLEDVIIPNDPLSGCVCVKCDIGENCCPKENSADFAYTEKKRLKLPLGNAIVECNFRCKCGKNCNNRVVQDGYTSLTGLGFTIFRTKDRGWGLRTDQIIPKGVFIGCYVGEILSCEAANKRGKGLSGSYLLDLDYLEDNEVENLYTIDAEFKGNHTHFINHSCDPNCVIYNVYVDCLDPHLPKVALFTQKEIKKGEELTFDYFRGKIFDPKDYGPRNPVKLHPCTCGTQGCRKKLPF